jgi:ComF family protein
MLNVLIKLIHIIGEFIFPETCVGCGQTGDILCPNCHQKITFDYDESGANIISALSYRDQKVRRLIWLLKYRGSRPAARILARFLKEAILRRLRNDSGLCLDKAKVILIPIPMTTFHRRQRGWNQAERLVGALAQLSPSSFTLNVDILRKTKRTPSQVSRHSRAERLRNLSGSFTLAPGAQSQLKGRLVVIVDDVTTTGTTLSEAMKTITTGHTKPRLLIGAAVCHG